MLTNLEADADKQVETLFGGLQEQSMINITEELRWFNQEAIKIGEFLKCKEVHQVMRPRFDTSVKGWRNSRFGDKKKERRRRSSPRRRSRIAVGARRWYTKTVIQYVRPSMRKNGLQVLEAVRDAEGA